MAKCAPVKGELVAARKFMLQGICMHVSTES